MATTTLNARIKFKKDTASNWTNKNPVLLDGERILVVTSAGEIRTKTGDGTKRFTALPYDDEALIDTALSSTSTRSVQNKIIKAALDEKQKKVISTTATLGASGWSSNSQTVSVSGVTVNDTIICAPATTSEDAWVKAGVKCSSQAAGKLTFTCKSVPTTSLTANIVIIGK